MKVDAKDAKRKQLQEWQKGQRREGVLGLESRTSELELCGVFCCMTPLQSTSLPIKIPKKNSLSKTKHLQEWEKGQREGVEDR